MSKVKITDKQLLAFTTNSSIGGSVLVIPALIVSIAKQDAWITALITPILGIPVIWIYCFLGSEFPNMTLVGIIKKVFGKWIGFIFSAAYVGLFLEMAAHIPWYVSNFLTMQVMPETPRYVINFLFMAAVILAGLYGIEAIARASEIFMYFVLISFLISMLLILPKVSIENIQPVLENGIIQIVKGSIFIAAFTTFPMIALLMIYPMNAKNIMKAKKSILKGYLQSGAIVFIIIFVSISVLGSAVIEKSRYPTYFLMKEIDVGVIFTRLEFVIAVVWNITELSIGILFFYSGVTGLSELFGLKDYKKIVIPMGIITFLMSGVIYPDSTYESNWIVYAWMPYILTYGLIIPLILISVFLIKKLIFKLK